MANSSSIPAALAPAEPLHRFTVEQYRAMARAGILTPDDSVELLEGWLVEKMTKTPPHRVATRRTRLALERIVPNSWYVDTQEPIATADSEPEPDVAVIRGRTEDYAATNPGADSVGLVVEVADATLVRDRELKGRVYARAGIRTYWILNLADRCLEVLAEPDVARAQYRQRAVLQAHESAALVLDGVEIGRVAVDEMLPPG